MENLQKDLDLIVKELQLLSDKASAKGNDELTKRIDELLQEFRRTK